MTPRFHAPDASGPGDRVRLPDDEARHLTRVLRLGPGAAVRIFNGRGGAFEATVAATDHTGAWLTVGAPCAFAPEPSVSVVLAAAVLKGDKLDEIVRDTVMLGVAAIQPVVTTRSEIGLAALTRSRRHERWARIAVSSAKQCGRGVVPPIFEPCSFEGLLDALGDGRLPAPAFLLAEPGAGATAVPLSALDRDPPRRATLLIGPEGGWTAQELEAAAPSCRLLTLGARTLRADAAPLVALSALFAVWREF